MADMNITAPVELTDADLDAVSAGSTNKQDGVVNVSVQDVNVAVQALNNKSAIVQ